MDKKTKTKTLKLVNKFDRQMVKVDDAIKKLQEKFNAVGDTISDLEELAREDEEDAISNGP